MKLFRRADVDRQRFRLSAIKFDGFRGHSDTASTLRPTNAKALRFNEEFKRFKRQVTAATETKNCWLPDIGKSA
jgi:hypothetical protein